jgi:hypothetical protein
MGETLKRHNLLFTDEEWQNLLDKAKELKISVSEFVRRTMAKELKGIEEMELSNYILQNCGYVSEEEEKDIMKSMESFEYDEDDFVEVSLDDILQG